MDEVLTKIQIGYAQFSGFYINMLIPVVFTLNLQYMKIFSSFKDIKVIQFSSMQDAFTGFSDKARTTLLISFEVSHLYL